MAIAAVVNASARNDGAERSAWLSQWLRQRCGIEAQMFLSETGAEIRAYARRAVHDYRRRRWHDQFSRSAIGRHSFY